VGTKPSRRVASVFVLLLGAAVAIMAAQPAYACPSCATGVQARAEVWDDEFEWNLFTALIPFLVIGAICLRAERVRRPALHTTSEAIAPAAEPRPRSNL
jgi:hypothetical protein